jgi:hypothetical protein
LWGNRRAILCKRQTPGSGASSRDAALQPPAVERWTSSPSIRGSVS